MDDFLDAIDASVKRLPTLVALLVAASVINEGYNETGESSALCVVWLLGGWSAAYWFLVVKDTMKKFSKAPVNSWWKYFALLTFVLVYISISAVAYAVGLAAAGKTFSLG